jgi:uncharacterized protein (TIGR02118 family)
MHKLVVLYPTPSDPAGFKQHYETRHIPLAAKLPGVRSIRFGYGEAMGPGAPPHFCIFEAEFDNRASLDAAMASDIGKKLAEDVPNYSPAGATVFHYAPRVP